MRERISEVIKILNISHVQFSKSVGRQKSWALSLITTHADSIKAKDILEMERVYNVNPMYILKGKKPVFLKGKAK